jgi:HTH-type transcriptional regulator, competence development regulator
MIIMTAFGDHVRAAREGLAENAQRFSLRQVATRIGMEPAYLSKVERGLVPPPSEATILKLAADLGEDGDVLLALAGKVSSDLQEIIRRRPKQFAELIRELKNAPNHAILRVVREVRGGNW